MTRLRWLLVGLFGVHFLAIFGQRRHPQTENWNIKLYRLAFFWTGVLLCVRGVLFLWTVAMKTEHLLLLSSSSSFLSFFLSFFCFASSSSSSSSSSSWTWDWDWVLSLAFVGCWLVGWLTYYYRSAPCRRLLDDKQSGLCTHIVLLWLMPLFVPTIHGRVYGLTLTLTKPSSVHLFVPIQKLCDLTLHVLSWAVQFAAICCVHNLSSICAAARWKLSSFLFREGGRRTESPPTRADTTETASHVTQPREILVFRTFVNKAF